jgi:amino acid transporter
VYVLQLLRHSLSSLQLVAYRLLHILMYSNVLSCQPMFNYYCVLLYASGWTVGIWVFSILFYFAGAGIYNQMSSLAWEYYGGATTALKYVIIHTQ